MRSTREEPATSRHSDQVIAWREQQLLAAGFDPALAVALAADRRRDLHALLELVERGCPPRLAARILSPLQLPPAAKTGGSR